LLGKEVRNLRKERNLSQEELAEAAKICLGTVKDLEWARAEPRILTLFDIAKGLKLPLAELIASVEKRALRASSL
jgi:transcriptional regulator with XRE-family HTH domain